ncbi:succinate-semialdehyde dehydrogenase [NAD(P)+] [Sporolactobacillus inulinus]|uniref:Succinate-semialdehyde dehydrogenase [NAD(P)+] n=1 Tax=Sporolactobacillus inulinus TaxID=2078 RepID=A0A4Y1ZEP8_9BACL|nr:succinate-semialdehyde dehydrogenase [NAD(P)+] [Sporolactobacillus inulinus]
MMASKDSFLEQAPKQLFIGGKWLDAESGAVDDVVNPATGEVIARVARGGGADTEKAIEAAQAAFPIWASLDVDERAKILRRVADLIIEKADELATI